MTRHRRTTPGVPDAAATDEHGKPRRRRPRTRPELELSDEELTALADEGIDPDDVRRLAVDREEPEASDHDRDTARDDVEGLVLTRDEDYG